MSSSTLGPVTGRYRVFHKGGVAVAERRVVGSKVPGTRKPQWFASARVGDVHAQGPPFDTMSEALAWGIERLVALLSRPVS